MTETTPEATPPADPDMVVLKVAAPSWVEAFHFIREGEDTIDITPAGTSVPEFLADAIIADAQTHAVTIEKQDSVAPEPAPAEPPAAS